ncbi:hypothetical protein ACEPAF_5949 [Sanghuangporus sanghuang]
MPRSGAKLFQPIKVGNLQLSHRIVLAPLTRFRADDAHVPTDIMTEYYAQRASVPGTLLITEATPVAAKAAGQPNTPGIWNDAQIEGWKKVVDAVHAQGSFIYMQIWATGRAAYPDNLALPDCPENPGGPYPYVSSSAVPLPDRKDAAVPRALTHEEILEYIGLFGQAAHNAVHCAGFDGVEIHGAHGYLVDQFTQNTCNERTDQWGGSVENRCRLPLEVIRSVVSAVGEERTAIRLSPFNTFQGMRMKHPEPTFAYLVSRIRAAYSRFSYIHVVEPRIAGSTEREALEGESNDFLRAIWKGPDSEKNHSVYFSAGGYDVEGAIKDAEEKGDLIVFGRHYISNPDLPARIKKEIALAPYDRTTFYTLASPKGYVDYTFADAESEAHYNAKRIEQTAKATTFGDLRLPDAIKAMRGHHGERSAVARRPLVRSGVVTYDAPYNSLYPIDAEDDSLSFLHASRIPPPGLAADYVRYICNRETIHYTRVKLYTSSPTRSVYSRTPYSLKTLPDDPAFRLAVPDAPLRLRTGGCGSSRENPLVLYLDLDPSMDRTRAAFPVSKLERQGRRVAKAVRRVVDTVQSIFLTCFGSLQKVPKSMQ